METLSQRVADGVISCKKAVLTRFYGFLQSNSGHRFTRKVGPVICVLIYFNQFVHALFMYTVFGPAFRTHFANFEPFATLFVLLGWWLCFKVTYLYFKVSTAALATPQSLFSHEKKVSKALDPSLPKK